MYAMSHIDDLLMQYVYAVSHYAFIMLFFVSVNMLKYFLKEQENVRAVLIKDI